MMDLEQEKNIETETPIPVFKKGIIFPEGHVSNNVVKVFVPPTNNNSEFDNLHNIVQFDIPCTYNALDPKELCFEGEITNPDNFPKVVDHSFHSLIKKIIVYNGLGEQIEIIEDYDFLMTMFFDMNLSRSERIQRQKNEGFGINKYGTDTAILWPSYDNPTSKTSTYDVLKMLSKDKDQVRRDEYSLNTLDTNEVTKLPKMENTPFDIFDVKDTIQNINNWDVVKNGQLMPCETRKKNANTLKFKIPLMLKSIGAFFEPGREAEEYREIPLGIFQGGLKILIFLNPTAFSIMVNLKEFEVLDLNANLPFLTHKNRTDQFLQSFQVGDTNPRRYTLGNANISMVQYRLDKWGIEKLQASLDAGNYVRNYRELEDLNIMYLKPYPVLQYTKNLSRKSIQRVMVSFTSDMYKRSPFARQHDRFNKAIQNMTFKLESEVYPKPTITRHDSLNTSGPENCNFFYAELRKGLKKQQFEQDYFLTRTNFAVNRNTSFDYSLLDCLKNKKISTRSNDIEKEIKFLKEQLNPFEVGWRNYYKTKVVNVLQFNDKIPVDYEHLKLKDISHLNNYIDPVASKTIYALHLIDGDADIDAGGVNCEIACPFSIDVTRLDDYEKRDPYSMYPEIIFFMHILVQYWSAIKLTGNGKTEIA